jgi:hypothetical protein
MKIKYLVAVVFASAQIAASAVQTDTNADSRSYVISLKDATSVITTVSITTKSNHDGKTAHVDSVEYKKACNPNAKEKISKGLVETGYQFTVLPEETDKMTFTWSVNHLDSMETISVDSCSLDLPKVSGIGGRRVLFLPVGKTSEFYDGKYFFTVKRTN